jgi:hypothetical protein
VLINADLSFACLVTPDFATTANNEYIMYAGSTSGYETLYASAAGHWGFDIGDGASNRVGALSPAGVKTVGAPTPLVGSYNYASKSAKITVDQSATYTASTATIASITSGVLSVGAWMPTAPGITGHIYDALVADINMHTEANLLATYISYINGRYGMALSTTAP